MKKIVIAVMLDLDLKNVDDFARFAGLVTLLNNMGEITEDTKTSLLG